MEFLSLKEGCTDSSEFTHVKMPHCWKSHVTAHILFMFLISKALIYFSDLRQNRNKLLELLTDPNHERATLEKTSDDYFSLLVGLIKPFEDGEAENKLRRAVKFKWTNTLLGNTPT